MKITEQAKIKLEQILSANKCDALKVTLQRSCCGSSLMFELANKKPSDTVEMINGISVIMDSEAKKNAEKAVVDIKNGELIVSSSCC